MAENNDKKSSEQISQIDLDELFEDLADSGILPVSDKDLIDQSELDSLFDEPDTAIGEAQERLTDEDLTAEEAFIEEITETATAEKSGESDVVSQADLDALFEDAAPSEPVREVSAAEGKTEPTAVESVEKASVSDVVSQADLDALFDDIAVPEEAEAPVEESESQAISQADLDALLEEVIPVKETTSAESKTSTVSAPEDTHVISQADLDALLEETSFEEEVVPAVTSEAPASEAESPDFLSQADLDALLDEAAAEEESGPGEAEAMAEAAPVVEESDLMSQSDLDALLEEAAFADEAAPSKKEIFSKAEDSDLISQSDLDALLGESALEEEVSEAPEEEPYSGIMTQSDLDALLASSSEEDISAEDDAASEMVSQDDLDALLAAPTDEEPPAVYKEPDEDRESSLISQDDLDALLALEEDDEVIEDVAASEQKEAAVVSPEPVKAVSEEPVILEAPDEVLDPHSPKAKFSMGKIINLAKFRKFYNKKKLQDLYRRRYFKAAAAAVIVLMISLPLIFTVKSYFKEKQPVAVNTFKIELPDSVKNKLQVVTGDAAIIAMNGFVVLPPSVRSGVSYMTMDVSIKVTDPKTQQQIKDNTTYIRNIIYELLQNTLRAMDKSEINQVVLEAAIQKTLNLSLEKEAVSNIFIENYDII